LASRVIFIMKILKSPVSRAAFIQSMLASF
jgi:hypothetical protein